MTESIWAKNSKLPSFDALSGDLKTDVLIVGGGMAGLLCAHRLSRAGVDCTLMEADRLFCGVSRNTTAKITSQHGPVYHKLVRQFGPETAYLYWQANEEALAQLCALGADADCDLERKDHFVYSAGDLRLLEEEMAALIRAKISAQWAQSVMLPMPTVGAIRFARQAQFDPLKFAVHIAQGLQIYENTKALEFAGNTVTTPRGKIRASKIIIATHFPILNKHGAYFLKLYQQRSYVLALENGPQVEGMYLAAEENGLSLRNAGSTLLLGGGGHRTGKKGQGWAPLEAFARTHCAGAREICRWATQDCMSLDGIPYIGQYSKNTPDLLVATGFNKWGMTGSMVAAMLLTDLVQGKKNDYQGVFAPDRQILRPQLAVNGVESVLGLLTPVGPRCPHLGCALKYNPQEHSWDCPCHGSRFTEEGKLLDNPATADKKLTHKKHS